MDAPEILKWVGIAFAAGFIGYFGRYLAMFIIDRVRSRKTPQSPGETPTNGASTIQADSLEKDAKLEKKRLKLEKKKAKKAAK